MNKYKVRVVLEHEFEVPDKKTIKQLKEMAEELKPELAEDFGIERGEIKTLTIKKVTE